jgi:hypothetical protein
MRFDAFDGCGVEIVIAQTVCICCKSVSKWMGGPLRSRLCRSAIAEVAGSATTLAASCRNWRRTSFMAFSPITRPHDFGGTSLGLDKNIPAIVLHERGAVNVRYWPKADIVSCTAHVRISGVKRT